MTVANFSNEDRVRKSSPPESNRRIDAELAAHVRLYARADREEITRRLAQLDQEWDIERVLQTNASSLVLLGTFLGVTVSRKWLFLPAVVGGFLLQHALQGWCPPIPALRRLGVRTRLEIEKERYALKVLRGDFDGYANGENRDVNGLLHSLDD